MNIKTNLTHFPLPYLLNGQKYDGSLLSWPPICQQCKSESCKASLIGPMAICSYGFNYQRLNNDMVIAGFITRNWSQLTPARKKAMRDFNDSIVSANQIGKAIESISRDSEQFQLEIESEKKRILDDYIEKQQFKPDFLIPLRKTIIQSLSFVHDYKQINTQISQNINVIIETKYSGNTLDDKLALATDQEKAIYQASKLLEEKLNVIKLLLNPSLMNKKDEFRKFRLHGLVRKYLGIYSTHIRRKNIDLSINGESYLEMIAHPDAVSVIPHTLIDNAIKYSQNNGPIYINIQDKQNSIAFSVSSYGPRIQPHEMHKIFRAFYRGEAAIKQEEEGSGYGLYISQVVAINHLGTEITVSQDPIQKPHYGHLTTFSLDFPLQVKSSSQYKLI